MVRVWGVVLGANLLGALAIAWMAARSTVFEPDTIRTFAVIGQKAVSPDSGTTMVRAVFAGWLIALIVWLLPFAETARVWVIFVVAYVVAVAGFRRS